MPFLRQVFSLVIFCLMFFTGCSAYVSNDDDSASTAVIETPEEDPITWEDCGGLLGDHPCDFTFVDQNGDEWNLYDNYGKVILLDFSTMWCGYCRVAAADVQLMQDTYGPDGFVWVTLLVDDTTGGDVSLDEVQLWANTYGITTAPVLMADRSIIDTTGEDGYPVTSWPMFLLVDRDMTISWGLRGWSQEMILAAIEDILGQ